MIAPVQVLENLIQAEDILGLMDGDRERWTEMLYHLPILLTDEEELFVWYQKDDVLFRMETV